MTEQPVELKYESFGLIQHSLSIGWMVDILNVPGELSGKNAGDNIDPEIIARSTTNYDDLNTVKSIFVMMLWGKYLEILMNNFLEVWML